MNKDDVEGIGFDATCSLVIQDWQGKPVSVCPEGNAFSVNLIKKQKLSYIKGM